MTRNECFQKKNVSELEKINTIIIYTYIYLFIYAYNVIFFDILGIVVVTCYEK